MNSVPTDLRSIRGAAIPLAMSIVVGLSGCGGGTERELSPPPPRLMGEGAPVAPLQASPGVPAASMATGAEVEDVVASWTADAPWSLATDIASETGAVTASQRLSVLALGRDGIPPWLSQPDGSVSYLVGGRQGGWTRISMSYANGADTALPLRVQVNGLLASTISLGPTGGWTAPRPVTRAVALNPGLNTVRLVRDASTHPGVALEALSISNADMLSAPGWQASVGGSTTYTVPSDYAGAAAIEVRYTNGSLLTGSSSVLVNGVPQGKVSMPPTRSWLESVTAAPVFVSMAAGQNRITLQRQADDVGVARFQSLAVRSMVAPNPVPNVPPAAVGLPPIDLAAIPAPRPGSSRLDVARTGELPRPGGDGIGAFRTVCLPSHFNFDDFLLYPGARGASHLHLYWGNTNVDASSTPESVATTGASTCRGGIANRSAYWAPAMIDTRSAVPQSPELIHVYYKSGYNGLSPASMASVPLGFRMIAGNSRSQVAQPNVWYRCGNSGNRPSMPTTCTPGDEMWMVVEFPQCWDGRNLSAPDHRSHVAFPSGGRCPSSHPVAMPIVTFNIVYRVPPGGVSTWRLSSDLPGSPPGSSGHADWVNGWIPEIKETWLQRCVRDARDCGSHIVGDGRIIFGSD